MRLTQALAPMLLVLLMAAPPWLTVAGQAPPLPEPPGLPGLPELPTEGAPEVPTLPGTPPLPPEAAPLEHLLNDLRSFLGGTAPSVVEQVQEPGGLGDLTGTLGEDLQSDLGNATNAPIRTLWYEGFEGTPGLAARGWTQEVLRGRAPWGLADAKNRTVERMDGTAFSPEFEGDPVFIVRDGRRAATLLNPQGRYDARVDARLISPVIDLRYVVGASQRTDQPYDLVTQGQEVGPAYQTMLDAWSTYLAPIDTGIPGTPGLGELTWLITTPPSQLQRLRIRYTDLSGGDGVPLCGGFYPCGAPGDSLFVNPLAERYGAALINLTFHHQFNLNPSPATPPPASVEPELDAYADGVFLEARVVRPDGSLGPWEHLHGDAVFEPNIDRGNVVGQSFFLSSFPPSSFLEVVQGSVGGNNEAGFGTFYNGRVLLRDYYECFGFVTQRVDCQPDAPAFVGPPEGPGGEGEGSRVKAHFTLNRFAGHQIQLAWRVHSGSGSIQAKDFGWFVDAIEVEALVPMRDPGVEAVPKPRPGDLVPTTVAFQPEATIRNFGSQRVEDLRVNFTVVARTPDLDPEALVAALTADANALQALVPAVQPGQSVPVPGVPGPPGATAGTLSGLASPPQVVHRTGLTIPRLEGLERRTVQAPVACHACAPGAYILVVEVATAPLSGGTPGTLPTDRAEDGSRVNNRFAVAFDVGDRAEAQVRLQVAPDSVLSDIGEPKSVRVELENRGNRELTGTVQVAARRLDPATLEPVPGEAELPAGALVVNPGDLPAGTRLTSYGAARNRFVANITWTPTNLRPGVYRLEATFEANPRPDERPQDQVQAFIRATPTAYYPGDGRSREDFDRVLEPVDGPLVLSTTARSHVQVGQAVPVHIGPADANATEAWKGDAVRVAWRILGDAFQEPRAVVLPALALNDTAEADFTFAVPAAAQDQNIFLQLTADGALLAELPLRVGQAKDYEDFFDPEVPDYLDVRHAGWRESQDEDPVFDPTPRRMPNAAVSLNHTWNATGADGALVELTALSYLAGHPGVGGTLPPPPAPLPPTLPKGPFFVGAVVTNESIALCTRTPGAAVPDGAVCTSIGRTLPYDALGDVVETSLDGKQTSFLNDYYLSRRINLTDCTGSCDPRLSFWHLGNFSWNPTVNDTVSVGGHDYRTPTGIQAADPLQVGENATRGMVEAVVLTEQGARLRQDLLPEEVPNPDGGAPVDPTRAYAALCRGPGADGCTVVESAPCVDSTLLPPVTPLPAPVPGVDEPALLHGRACATELLRQPVDDVVVLAEYRQDIPGWNRTELSLAGFKGHDIQLTFHFQSTLGRLTANVSQPTCTGLRPGETFYAVRCHWLQNNWALDNLRVFDAAAGGGAADRLSDTVGDRIGDVEWRNWTRFRTLRETLDQNVALDQDCYDTLNRPLTTDSAPAVADRLARCLEDNGNPFRGLVVGVDGRGWDVWTAGVDRRQNASAGGNGFENPFYDGWFIQEGAGYQIPGNEDITRTRALRFGGPGSNGVYPGTLSGVNSPLHSLATTGLMALGRAVRPFADFQLNYSFSPLDVVSGEAHDGAQLHVARYVCRPDPAGNGCVLERTGRTLVLPEGGYPERVKLPDLVSFLDIRGALPSASGQSPNNGFAGRSGTHPQYSTFVPVRVDLQQALPALCLKEVIRQGVRSIETHDRAACSVLDRNVIWDNGQGVHNITGAEYRNVTRFEEDPEGLYALEVHAFSAGTFEDFGLALDELRVGEQHLANDVGISRQVFPRPGGVVGPGESLQVRINVTNYGLFAQRGVRIHFNVTQQGAQVFPDPGNASRNPTGCDLKSCSQVTPLGTVIPGLRDANPQKNVSFAFENPWTPASEGVFTINTWVELIGEFVNGELIPLPDENRVNDRRTETLEVRKVHSIRLLPPEEQPDEAVVLPLVGTTEDRRVLRVNVENLGTVSEGKTAFDVDPATNASVPRALKVRVAITDEAGRPVASPEPSEIDLLTPGSRQAREFVWQPPSGGLFTLRFTAESALDLTPGDNERVVKVLVLTQLLPDPGEAWTERFSAAGTGFHNLSRFNPAAVWSFGSGDTYGPLEEGTLTLDEPVDLTNFRNAVLTLKHQYDLEQGYDGGVVEVSADGVTWQALTPLRTTDASGAVLFEGYPGALTSASDQVARPGDAVGAFTGDSGGVVTSVIPLGTVPLTRTDPVVLLRDTFDPQATLAGADLAEARGQWVEVRSKSEPPGGKAWWVNKSMPWRLGISTTADDEMNGDFRAVERFKAAFEGTKTLYAHADGLAIPKLDAPLVVEYDEWRGLGLSQRGTGTEARCQAGYCTAPNAVEVSLERLGEDLVPDFRLNVVPAAANTNEPYGDNHLEWTRRTIILPSQQVKQFHDREARLAFTMYLANSNVENNQRRADPVADVAHGGGSVVDTDTVSPHLGWAIAAPSIYYLTTAGKCAGVAGLRFVDGRCVVFSDDLTRYEDSDDAAGRADSPWSGGWVTDKWNRTSVPELRQTSGPRPDDLALVEGGWKLVDAVRLVTDKPVWDPEALAPTRSGRGRVMEATGSGVDSRVITPLNLRSATSEVVLSLDHSFKLTDLTFRELDPPMAIAGGVSGGRVEVSRDGGQSWEPLVPMVAPVVLNDGSVDRQAYTGALRQLGFKPTFVRGTPAEAQQCNRPTHPGCIDPADPFRAPGGWLADDEVHGWFPFPDASAHTPFGSLLNDPERNSAFGVGSYAFSGTTCVQPLADLQDICGQAADWQRVRFDLTPYAGQEVLLAFHAFFTTHRFATADHPCLPEYIDIDDCDVGPRHFVVPRDFWRVDNVTVESRVLDGKPVWLRLRGFSDGNGERYGWDIHNLTLLGDRHVRNLGVRVLAPAPGAPLFGAQETIDARVVNRGQEPLRAQGTVVVEQVGAPALVNGDFEQGVDVGWVVAPDGAVRDSTADPAEGTIAARDEVNGEFTLSQRVKVPAGRWRLVGLADTTGGPGDAGARVLGAAGLDGKANPAVAFAKSPTRGAYLPFEVPFVVEGEDAFVTVQVLSSRNLFGDFRDGILQVDHLRLEPLPLKADGTVPGNLLVNPSFEGGLEGWTLSSGELRGSASGESNRWRVFFEEYNTRNITVLPAQDVAPNQTAFFNLDVRNHNVTNASIKFSVSSTYRLTPETLSVVVRPPNSTAVSDAYTLRAGAAVPVPNLTTTFINNSLSVDVPLQVPLDDEFNATSREAALGFAPPINFNHTGIWNISVIITAAPGQEALQTSSSVEITATLTTYEAYATPISTAGGLENVFEGTRAAVLTGLGRGPGDFDLQQALALPPGKYRLEGLFGSRAARVETGPEAFADRAAVALNASGMVQELDPATLPRHVTGLHVLTPVGGTGTIQAQLEGPGGQVLGTAGSGDAGGETVAITGLDAHVPEGVEKVFLRLSISSGSDSVRAKADDAYAGGTLQGGCTDGACDLRVAILGAPEDRSGRNAVAFAGGAGGAGRVGPPGAATFTVPLVASMDPQVRQVVDVGPAEARRITSVAFQVQWPAAGNFPANATLNYSIRQGDLRVQLFDLEGRPLSEEATVYEYAKTGLLGPPQSIPASVGTLVFNFTNAVLPADATRFVVGIRAMNFTAANPVLLRTVLDLADDSLANGWLEVDGRGDDPGECRTGLVAEFCDVPMEFTYAREPRLAVDVVGAQADAVLLTQPLTQAATFDGQPGAVPFQLDFTVPQGRAAVAVRLRADQWQGDAVFDGLRVVPLTPPAFTFAAEVAPGQEAAVLGPGGAAPAFVTLRGASYRITTEAVSVDGAGNVLGELLLGDNRAARATGAALGPGRLEVVELVGDPNSINLTTAQGAQLRLAVRNGGATEAELLRATGTIRTKAGALVAEFSQADFEPIPENLTLAPLEQRVFLWPYQPDPTLAHGVYVLEATLTTVPVGEAAAFESTRRTLLYMGTDFHDQFAFEWAFGNATLEDALTEFLPNPEELANSHLWTSSAVHNDRWPPTNECNPPPGGQDACHSGNGEARLWVWHKTDDVNLSAYRSIALGRDEELPFPNLADRGVAAGTLWGSVRSPAIPIADMLRPQLLYADRHQFNGVDAEGSIYARLIDRRGSVDNWTAFPVGDCLTRTPDEAALRWVRVDDHITGTTPQFNADKWILRNVDLGPLMDRAANETGRLEDFTHVQLCWLLEQPSPRTGANLIKEWSLDDILVTPYGAGLGPSQRIPITDNVTKDFRLVLRNNGAYTDTYRLGLEEETGLPSKGPSNWKVSLRDGDGRPLDEVRVRPGEERVVTVRVRVDVAPPTLAREGTVDLAVTAISKTTAFLRSTQHLVFDFTYEDRPNLRVAGLIVNDPALSVDKPRTVDVLVQNTGSVVARNVRVAVVDKMDPAFGVPPEELRQLDGTEVPPLTLAPGDTHVVTVNWVPHVAGEHNLTGIVDPGGRILEFDERDNTLVKPIVVPKAEFPDLLVEASASTANPSPGDLVEVQMRITNKGGAPATGIQVSLRAGVTDLLPGEPPHVLPIAIRPGETHVLNASWRPAFPGEQTIILRARTFAGILETLDTSGDNVVLLVIKVRSRGLDMVLPPDLAVAPGALANATIEVHNRGDVDDTYRIVVEPPDDWRGVFPGLGEDILLTVGNHSHRNLTVQVGPPRHAESGPYQVKLRASSQNGTEALEAHLVATVPQDYGLRFEVAPEHLVLPGARFLPITLRNSGNGFDLVTVRARSLPAGWTVEPTTFGVPARSTQELRLNLSSPTTTPEGAYDLVLEAQGKGAGLLAQGTKVQILPYELLRLEVQGVPEVLVPGTAHRGSLVVRNAGNLEARAALQVTAPEGWPLRLERDVVSVNPGEARTLDLGLVVPANASDKAQALVALAESGRGASYDLTRVVRPASVDLEVVALEQLPRGQARDGAVLTIVAHVANRGEVPLPAPLAVYVDDVLLGYENGPTLAPGEEARINVSFKARGGEHVLLVAADPAQVLGEADETNNAKLLVMRVDRAGGLFAVPGPEPWLVALAVAGLALILRTRSPPGAGPPRGPRGVDR